MTNPTHVHSAPETQWTHTHMSEAIPGVITPLTWSVWTVATNRSFFDYFYRMGVLSRAERDKERSVDERCTGIFFGRAAINLSVVVPLASLGPGVSGKDFEQQLFATSTSNGMGIRQRGRLARLWSQALFYTSLALMPLDLARKRREVHAWWRHATRPEVVADRGEAMMRLREAMRQYLRHHKSQMLSTSFTQALFTRIKMLCERVGLDGLELRLTTGLGAMDEVKILTMLWNVSRGDGTLEAFTREHGYHGPMEGELISASWREDSTSLKALIATYRLMDDTAGPAATEQKQMLERKKAERELFALLKPHQKIPTAILLAIARRYIPLREVGKGSFLRGLDGIRAAARTIGADWAERGLIDRQDDIFFLQYEEVVSGPPHGVREIVAHRRQLREDYEKTTLPAHWRGCPERVPLSRPGDHLGTNDAIEGIGACAGVVTGRAHVAFEPNEASAIAPGEILVCEMTDPSWVSAFFVAAGVVIDVGSTMSHGAIVARELGIPCVINARTATARIRSGDTIRVDGTKGSVDILERSVAEDAA